MENKLILTQDGSHTLLSGKFHAHYHSLYGAMQESQHVFIQNGLSALKQLQEIRILEMGFGTGLNAWLTFLAVSNSDNIQRVVYTAYETNPVSEAEARALNYADAAGADSFLKLHQCEWNKEIQLTEKFRLVKNKAPVESSALPGHLHLIYHDAFAPSLQPELWNTHLFTNYFKALSPGGMLVTYCAKGDVKRALRAAGFVVERLPGPPGKRHMLRAIKANDES